MAALITAGASGGISDIKTTIGLPVADLKIAAARAAASAAQYKAVGHG